MDLVYSPYDVSSLRIEIESRKNISRMINNTHTFHYDRVDPATQRDLCRYVSYHLIINSIASSVIKKRLEKKKDSLILKISQNLVDDKVIVRSRISLETSSSKKY